MGVLKVRISSVSLFAALATLAAWSAPAPESSTPTASVLDRNFPDPMILQARDGYFYAYATGSHQAGAKLRISVTRSRDLKTWAQPWEAFATHPKWAHQEPYFWAPHVVEHSGKYIMFYSAQPSWSKNEHMRLGIAVSGRPEGPFIDLGENLDTGDADENIDAMVFTDPFSNKTYLYWGRNGVLTAQELDSSLLGFAKGSQPIALLESTNRPFEKIVEAPYIVKRGVFYYLFYSGDDCCDTAHYAVMVARSKSPLGPFERAPMPVVQPNTRWTGTGHNSIFSDSLGHDWIAYHAINPNEPREKSTNELRRVLMINRIEFDSGWPRMHHILPLVPVPFSELGRPPEF